MDIFFRQYWIDERLTFEGSNELVIGAEILQEIWLPDTFYFYSEIIRQNPIGTYLSRYSSSI